MVIVREQLDLQLASTSPRRRELLVNAGLRFVLCEPGPEYAAGEGDEHGSAPGAPELHALQRATRKGEGAVVAIAATPVLAVDTVVDLDGRELGKPRDRGDAERMLRALAGRVHRVHTAHWLGWPGRAPGITRLCTAEVACGQPDAAELAHYLASEQWRGKAGSYGVQDAAQSFFRVVDGSIDTVVGLHVAAVRELLALLPEAR